MTLRIVSGDDESPDPALMASMNVAITSVRASDFPPEVIHEQIEWITRRFRSSPTIKTTAELSQENVSPGDIVLLRKQLTPEIAFPEQRQSFSHGIVTEILKTSSNGRVIEASLYLYDPDRREILMGPFGVPQFIDMKSSEFELYKRAGVGGYQPITDR